MLIRVGGLPFTAADALGSAEIAAALRRARELDEQRRGLGQTIADLLFARIHAARDDHDLRIALLALKRDVHNGRATIKSRRRCSAGLTPETDAALAALDGLDEAIQQHAANAATLVEAQVAAGRRQLRTIAALPDFRAGLLTSSASFERSLDAFLRWKGGPPDRKRRHTEEALLSFIYRTTHKTSPFSRLTLVCRGVLGEGDALIPDIDGSRIIAEVRPNLSLLARVRYLLVRNMISFPTLEVVLPAGIERSAAQVHYRRRVETLLTEPGPVHAVRREFAYSLRVTPSLDRILDRLAAGPATVEGLLALLRNGLGMAGDAATAYLELLADKDLLRPAGLDISVLDANCWAGFGERIGAMGDPRLVVVAEAVTRLANGCARYGYAEADERHTLVDEVGTYWDAAIQALEPGAATPRPLLYEDATLGSASLALRRDAWAPVVEHLPTVQRFLSLFDPLLPSRLSLRAIFVRTYGPGGRCDDIAGFSDIFHDRFFSAYQAGGLMSQNRLGTGRLNPQFVPDLAELERTKQRVLTAVAERREHATPREILLSDALVAGAGEMGTLDQPYLANAFYLQLATIAGRPAAVLNRVYGGGGAAFSRFRSLFAKAGGHAVVAALPVDTPVEGDAGSRLYAEFQAGYDTNLNQHAPLTATQIILPGERAAPSLKRQVALAELSIRHDPERDRLYLFCARLGVEIVPIYAGMFYPLAMPELQTLLMHFSCPVTLQGVFFPPPGEGNAETPGFYPRIRYHNLVLERARWMFDAADTLTRVAGESDYALMVRWDAWRTAHALPATCFAKVLPAAIAAPADRAQQKPFFVDFANPFCLTLLEKALKRRNGTIHFTEALPDPDDAAVTVDGERRVAECVIECHQELVLRC